MFLLLLGLILPFGLVFGQWPAAEGKVRISKQEPFRVTSLQLMDSVRAKVTAVPGMLGTGSHGLYRTDVAGMEGEVSIGQEIPAADRALDSSNPQGWETIVSEGFEGEFPAAGWMVFASSGFTDVYWDDNPTRSQSGSWSAWCADEGAVAGAVTDQYVPNMLAWMIFGPFDLSDATDAQLEFHLWLDTEAKFDFFYWLAATDLSDFQGFFISGNSGGWVKGLLDLTDVPNLGDLTGEPQVWIAFLFESDETVELEGAYVDDIILQQLVDREPPIIDPIVTPTTADAGVSIRVEASADDPSGVAEFYLEYFVGADASGTRVDFSAITGGTATIPGSAVSVDGLYYVINAEDNVGNLEQDLFFVTVNVAAGAVSHATVAGTNESAYRLFSVPLDLQNKAFNSFFSGLNDLGTNGTDWRFFAYGGGSFIEYTSSTTTQITVGRGYFLITRDRQTIRSKAGFTYPILNFIFPGISLSSGWNLVGNPLPYGIPLSLLELANREILANVAWDWSGGDGWTKGNLSLEPWEGLAIRVSSNTNLRFSLSGASLMAPPATVASDRTASNSTTLLESVKAQLVSDTQWLVQIVARDEHVKDQVNYVGVMPDANDGYDEYDWHEPPILPDAVSLHFVKDDWDDNSGIYATDIRSPTETGHVWEATVV
ncbi:MAG: hypothetical protein V3U69_05210, partial [Bacteroidota bacterium]